jgi:predicted transposase YbfD/YdcC
VGPWLTGADGVQDLALWGQSTSPWLPTCRALPPGIPSHETCGRVFARLKPQRLQACWLAWPQAVAPRTRGARSSRDGQTVQAAWERAPASSPWHRLSAWWADNGGLGLGQSQTRTQANAIPAMPALLPWCALKGWLVTLEALGCQTASARQSRDPGGDALLALQGHHQQASTAVKQSVHPPIAPQLTWRTAATCFAACDAAHGRPGRRRVWALTDGQALPARAHWPALHSVLVGETLRAASPGAPITRDDRL